MRIQAGGKPGYTLRINSQALAKLTDAGLASEARIASLSVGGGRPEVSRAVDVNLRA